jgi:hypothetical protein
MEKTHSLFKKITSLLLSLVFAISSFAVVGFSNSTAETAEAAVGDDYYFMAYFTGNNRTSDGNNVWNDPEVTMTQATRFAVSSDGVHFSALNKNRPAIIQQGGTQNSRDHFAMKGQDGKYYILATDANYSDNVWSKECNGFVLWRSDDLLTWEEKIIDLHDVTGLSDKFLNYAWAPEIIWDSELNKYLIYFALQSDGVTKYQTQMMYYIAATNLWDVSTWEYPQIMFDCSTACIDGNITYSPSDNLYYMFYKNEAGGGICLAKSEHAHGPYTYFGLLSTTIETGALEGCQVYMNGDNYYLFADRYAKGLGNFAIYNLGTDLSKLSLRSETVYKEVKENDVTTVVSEDRDDVLCISTGDSTTSIGIVDAMTGFGNLSPRHGSIIKINKTQYEALLAKYTGSTDDDIRYDFSRKYMKTDWHYDTYTDTSGHTIDLSPRAGSSNYIKIPAGGGYASIGGAFMAVNDPDVEDMIPDDVYTIDFNFTLDVDSTASGTVFALSKKTNDYLMLFGNGDIWYRGSGSDSDTFLCNTSIEEGINYKFCFVSDGTYITAYKNGEKIGKVAATVDFPDDHSGWVSFGNSDAHNIQVTGTYYDIRFRDYAIGAGQVKSEYKPNLAYRYNSGTTDSINGRDNVTDATGTQIRMPDYEGATDCHDVTFSFMYNPGSAVTSGEAANIFVIGSGGKGVNGEYFLVNEGGYTFFNYADGTTDHYFDVRSDIFNGKLSANTWHHIMIMVHWDEINEVYLIKAYVNGSQTYSATNGGTNLITSRSVDKFFSSSKQVWFSGVSGDTWWPNSCGGYIDDFRIYGSKNLDASDLYADYQDEYTKDEYSEAATAEVKTYVQNNLESYDVTSLSYRNAYHNGHVATGGFNNVVASATGFACNDVWSNSTKYSDIHYAVFYPTDIVLCYDGVNTPALPCQLEMHCYGNNKTLATIYCSDGGYGDSHRNANFRLAHYWTGYITDYTQWAGDTYAYNHADYPINDNGKAEVEADGNSHIGYYAGWQWDYNFAVPRGEGTGSFFWNKLNYTGTVNTTTYKETHTTTPMKGYMGGDFSIVDCNHNVYVLNYKPIYDILKSSSPTPMPNGFGSYGIKQFYTAFIKGQEDSYTEDSLNQFYVAAYKVLKATPLSYSESTYQSNFSGTVDRAAADIKEAVEEFNDINLVKRADFSVLDTAYSNANTEIAKLGTSSQVKTTSSIRNLISVVNKSAFEPNDGTFDRANLTSADYQDAIDEEAAAINSKITALDTIANMSTFDTAYALGRNTLLALDGKQAQYKATAINNLKTALTTGSTVAYANSDDETRLDYGQAVQTTANEYATSINNAVAALSTSTNENYIDVSAFNPVYNKITKLDTDAYDDESTSISSAISGAEAAVTYTTAVGYDGATINVIDNSVDQDNVDAAVSTMLTALSNSVKKYNITATAGVDISANNGTYEDGKASYGTKMTFDSGDANTAWYMSYRSGTTARAEQYLGYGARVSTNLLGDLNVRAVKKSADTPYMVTINRNYDDNTSTHGIILRTYSGSTYTLPAAPAIAYYDFVDYTYNGVHYDPDDEITITGNHAVINANYEHNSENAYTVKISSTSGNGDLYNASAKYNTKIEKSAAGAYGWVKVKGGKETMFYVGSDLTYFVADSIELKAVATKPSGYTGVPTVYLRDSGAAIVDADSGKKKITINGNYVTDGYEVLEYGVLLGKATTGTITDEDVVVENSGTQTGYKVLRAKATKTVGANQFSIAINVPTATFTGAFKYRGYVMYKDGTEIKTVYTDIVNDSI